MEEDASMKFFSDQNTSYADILPPREVKFPCWFSSWWLICRFETEDCVYRMQARARIEVSVLNLLRVLNSPDPAISDLSLVL